MNVTDVEEMSDELKSGEYYYYILDNSNPNDVHIKKFDKEEEAFSFLIDRDLERYRENYGLEYEIDYFTDNDALVFDKSLAENMANVCGVECNWRTENKIDGICLAVVPKEQDKFVDYVRVLEENIVNIDSGEKIYSKVVSVGNREVMLNNKLEDENFQKMEWALSNPNENEYVKVVLDGRELSSSDFSTFESKKKMAEEFLEKDRSVYSELKGNDTTVKIKLDSKISNVNVRNYNKDLKTEYVFPNDYKKYFIITNSVNPNEKSGVMKLKGIKESKGVKLYGVMGCSEESDGIHIKFNPLFKRNGKNYIVGVTPNVKNILSKWQQEVKEMKTMESLHKIEFWANVADKYEKEKQNVRG